MATLAIMTNEWTSAENERVVAAYLEMLQQEVAGQPIVKSEVRRAVAAEIGRTAGAVEYKMQNVSAALEILHCQWIEGYKPARNLQRSLLDEVRSQVVGDDRLLTLLQEDVTRTAVPMVDFAWSECPPPGFAEPLPEAVGNFQPMPVDFARLEADNRRLGQAGELAVLQREKSNLINLGHPDLAAEVRHVSAESGDGAGYDIRSFTPGGEERFLEVKTTRRNELWPMWISANEVEFSKTKESAFELHRVFHFGRQRVGLFVLAGAVPDTCWLTPATYRAVARARAE